jgi:O-antigen/teichoic acid export membrane protein
MSPSYSLNITLSEKKNEKDSPTFIWSSSLIISVLLITVTFVSCLVIMLCWPAWFAKYFIRDYGVYLLLIFILNSFNHLYVNLYRPYGVLKKINFFEIIVPVFQFFAIVFFREQELLFAVLSVTIFANALALIIFIIRPPVKFSFNIDKQVCFELFMRGVNLLLYNISFSLILLSSRTIVSIFYPLEQLGFYTFAVNLSSAIFMIVGSFGFVLYPKLINKAYASDNKEVKKLLHQIRSLYIAGCFLLTYVGFFSIPVLEYLLPQYVSAMTVFKILLITQLILNNNFGYSILLIAKKRERVLTIFSILGIILMTIFSVALISVGFSYVAAALAVSVALIFYCLAITSRALKEIEQPYGVLVALKETFPIYYLIPILVLCIGIPFNDHLIFAGISLISFLVLNKSRIIDIKHKLSQLISNRDSLKY